MKAKYFLFLIPILVLFGCADSSTQGDEFVRNYRQNITITNHSSGNVVVNFPVSGISAETDTETTQDTSGKSSISPSTSLSDAGSSALSLAGEGGKLLVDTLKSAQDNTNNSNTKPTVPEVVTPKKPDISDNSTDVGIPSDTEVSSQIKTVYLKPEGDGGNQYYTWLHQEGYKFPFPMKVDMGPCGTYIIPDTKYKWMPDMNKSHHQQFTYFSGWKLKEGSDELQRDRNNGLASIFSPPYCKETSATLTYPVNKDEWELIGKYKMQKMEKTRPFFSFDTPGSKMGDSLKITDSKNEFIIPDASKDYGDPTNQYFFTGDGEVKTSTGNASLLWYSDGDTETTIYKKDIK